MSASSSLCEAAPETDVELYIEFAVAVPSFVLYGLVFVVYKRSKEMRSPYYLIFVVHSWINIVFFLSRALLTRVSSFSSICQWVLDNFGNFEYYFTALFFLKHYTQHAQAISIMAINVNRVLAVYCYKYLKIMRYSTHFLLFTIFFIPLPLTWHLLISPVKFVPFPPMVGVDYWRVVKYPGLSLLHVIVNCAAMIVVILTSILILARLMTLQTRRKTSERSLIVVSLLLSFGLLLSATVEFLVYSMPSGPDRFFMLNRRWIVTNFVSLFPPWSLLLLSSVARAEARYMFLQAASPLIKCLLGRLPTPSIRNSTGRTMMTFNA